MEGLNSHLKDRYKRLERRALFLRERILNGKGSSKDNSYDRRELSGLEWAMRIVLKYYTEHPMEDDTVKPCEECINGVNPADGSPCTTCGGIGEVTIPPKIRKREPYVRK